MGKSAKAEVAEYRLSVHFGLCTGPVDALRYVEVDEKGAWYGEVNTMSRLDLYQPNLFGGAQKEGGLDGIAWYLPGDENQVLPDALANRLVPGATGAQIPGFRGMASIFFVGSDDRVVNVPGAPVESNVGGYQLPIVSRIVGPLNLLPGFVWGHNNPYIKNPAFRLQRRSRGLTEETAVIQDPTNAISPDDIRKDSNPAHIIYECLTNTDWGMANDAALIDTTSFNLAADTLFNENFGLSFQWDRNTTVQAFVDSVIKHIEGAIYIHPTSGLWTLKLFRADYDTADLPTYDTSNSTITSFGRRLLGETINEMTITWTNPRNLKSEPITVQDLGNIIQQGTTIPDKRDFPGIRRRDIAALICQRELRSAAAPLATATVKVMRSGYSLVPGSVIKLTSVEHDLNAVVFRVLEVNYGRVGQRDITLTLLEDIFARPYAVHFTGQAEYAAPTRSIATDLTNVQFMTAPAYWSPRLINDPIDDASALVVALAPPNNSDSFSYELWSEQVNDNGDLEYALLKTNSLLRRAVLSLPLVAEATTTMALPIGTNGVPPKLNGFLVIGNSDGLREIAFLSAFDEGTNQWTVQRGVLDTIPRAWPAATVVYTLDLDTPVADTVERALSETVKYKLLPSTTVGPLPLESATERTYTVLNRPQRPIRPANCKLGNVGFGPFIAGDAPFTASWANRNRLLEDVQVLYWTSPGIAAEVGQTTTLKIYGEDSNSGAPLTPVNTITGLTGESRELDDADFLGLEAGWVEFVAVRDGLESYQSYMLHFTRVKQSSNSTS